MWLTNPVEIEKVMLEEAQQMPEDIRIKMGTMYANALRERGVSLPSDESLDNQSPIAASAGAGSVEDYQEGKLE